MKLSDKALLTQLSISQWTARKYDKRATEQVASANSAVNQSGRYNKSLLPMNDFLANVHQKSTLIRKRYYANTLPWGIDGTQILPSANYLAFMTDFRKEKYEWQMVVNQFLQEYESLKYDAVQHMAEKLADPAAVFRDTLVENTSEICAVMSRLNFTDDPNLEAMRLEVEQSLTKHHPDALRNDPDLRRDKAAEAKAIMDKMGVFMGGTQ